MEEGLGGKPGSASAIGIHLTSRDSVSSLSAGSDDAHLPEPCALSGKPLVQCLVRESVPSDSVIGSAREHKEESNWGGLRGDVSPKTSLAPLSLQ